eukprot:364917_1
MASVLRKYLEGHDEKCPTNAHILVEYSKQNSHLKTLQWMDAHVLIENYMIHGKIIGSDNDTIDAENSHNISSKLFTTAGYQKSFEHNMYNAHIAQESQQRFSYHRQKRSHKKLKYQRTRNRYINDSDDTEDYKHDNDVYESKTTHSALSKRNKRNKTKYTGIPQTMGISNPFYIEHNDVHIPKEYQRKYSNYSEDYEVTSNQICTKTKQHTQVHIIPFAIHHKIYPITQKTEQFNTYLCAVFTLIVIWICVSSLMGYAASQIFITAIHKTQQNNAYYNSFNINGECIITQRKQHWSEGAESVTSYYHIYQYKIYNHSSCNGTLYNNTYSMTESVNEKSTYKYEIGDIFTCIANENCEIIEDKYEFENDTANGGVYFAGVLICICACISCATPPWMYYIKPEEYNINGVEWREYVKYKSGEDKELHYVYQWNNIMTDKQRIDYYVNYYGRKYELNMYDTINEMLFTYLGSDENHEMIETVSRRSHHTSLTSLTSLTSITPMTVLLT